MTTNYQGTVVELKEGVGGEGGKKAFMISGLAIFIGRMTAWEAWQ